MKNPKLGASLLSVPNFLLKDRSIKLKEAGIDYFHIDIMDGNFVSNLSFSPSLYHELYQLLPESDFDLHFMVTDAAFNNLINKFIQYPPKYLSIHWEAKIDWESISLKLRNMKIKFGIAINPKTEIDEIESILPKLDFVLLMSVNPGYGGQIFLEESYKKIS